MQVTGRWKSSQMPAHYAKAELAERGTIARFKNGKGSVEDTPLKKAWFSTEHRVYFT